MLRFTACIQQSCGDPQTGRSLSVNFDDALVALGQLPRLFIEPDGSFVWRGADADGRPWQVDGNLTDRGEVLDLVELKGFIPGERLDDILHVLGWPETTLTFQLPRRGVFLTEEEFRRQAATPEGAG